MNALIGISLATWITILVLGVKVVQHATRIEMKVDLMWSVFELRYGDDHHE